MIHMNMFVNDLILNACVKTVYLGKDFNNIL